MLITTNYSHIPIATTNFATDAMRADNIQRPVVQPITNLTRSHSERKLNTNDETFTPLTYQNKKPKSQHKPKAKQEKNKSSKNKTNTQEFSFFNQTIIDDKAKKIRINFGFNNLKLDYQTLFPIDQFVIKHAFPELINKNKFYRKVRKNIAKFYYFNVKPDNAHHSIDIF